MTAAAIRVVIADDQPLVRSGLVMLLDHRDDIEVVGEAGDGRAALDAVMSLHPDVVLMDVRMPGMDGLAATQALVDAGLAGGPDASTRVLVLSTYHVDEAVHAALRIGASGFVLKDAAPDELVAAVRAVAGGGAWLDPAVAHRLIASWRDGPPSTGPDEARLAPLTDREREVLALIGRGLNNTELAAHLGVGPATIKTHIQRILFKLHLRDRVDAVILAYEVGLVQPAEARRLTR